MKVIDTKAAVRNRQGSRPYSIWSFPNENSAVTGFEETKPGNGGQRVYDGRISLSITPKFKIPAGATFFTAGSCFAREIEFALHHAGFTVNSWNPDRPLNNELFHRYNTYSIINDFEFAGTRVYDTTNICAVGTNKFIDYSGYGTRETPEAVLEERRSIIDIYRSAFTSDVIVLTLGLVEAWYDRVTRTYLNLAPYEMFARHGDRFELRITDYAENKYALTNLINHLREMNPAVKIIVTVSPVPFSDTFSGQDVVVANTYSKSVLRSVAYDIAQEFDCVDYFPSYEIVMLSDPALAWLPDRRHVQRDHVAHIVQQFVANYLEK